MNLPKLGTRVRLWPRPGHCVPIDHRPIIAKSGGRAAPDEGFEADLSAFHVEMLRSGDLLMFDPRPNAASAPSAARDALAAAAHAEHSAARAEHVKQADEAAKVAAQAKRDASDAVAKLAAKVAGADAPAVKE
jgi:hypothetical protein